MATLEEKIKFGRHKAGYKEYPPFPKEKPKNGDLVYERGTYKEVLYSDKPMALLQHLKKQKMSEGILSKYLKIRYHAKN